MLEGVLSPALRQAVRKVDRVDWRHGEPIRFDIYVLARASAQVLAILQANAAAKRWYGRRNISFAKRRAHQRRQAAVVPAAPQIVVPPIDPGCGKFATWNVNGARAKKGELQLFMRRRDIGVLCVQETRNSTGAWPLRLPGYLTLEVPMEAGTAGRRGVAIVVARELVASPGDGARSPWMVWVKVLIYGRDWIMVSVYIPTRQGSLVRREALASVRVTLMAIMARNPGVPLVVGGDWNMAGLQLAQWLQKVGLSLVVNPVRGSDVTFRRGRQGLDHFVVSASVASLFRPGHVDRTWDTSDHWPLVITLHRAERVAAALAAGPAERWRLDRVKVEDMEEQAEEFAQHPLFSALLQDMDAPALPGQAVDVEQAAMSTMVDRFHEVVKDVAADMGLVAQPGRGGRPGLLLRSATIRAIEARRRCLRAVGTAATLALATRARLAYALAVRRAKGLVSRDRKRFQMRQVVAGAEAMQEKERPRHVWDWVRQVMGAREGTSAMPAVRNRAGDLILDPAAILEVWADHYETIQTEAPPEALTPDGNGYWEQRLTMQQHGPLPVGIRRLLNRPLTWPELHRTIVGLPRGKTGGASGITAEILKMALDFKPRWQGRRGRRVPGPPPPRLGAVPRTVFGKVLNRLACRLWDSAFLPDSLSEALVASLYKRVGDVTQPDNYRGISLIEVLTKLLTTVEARRVAEAVEAADRLRPEQAGFRFGEESIAQVVTLFEVCQRRMVRGLLTYIIFIDIKKAYDKVPHGALRAKLRAMGITGQALRMFDAIYRSAAIRVRMACGDSRRVMLVLGVRQGEPSSPIFFDIFFNDFRPAPAADVGVAVPGMPGTYRVDGLDYADDASLFCEDDLPGMQARLDVATTWADLNCQVFGISKCGVMAVGGTPAQQAALGASRPTLQGEALPLVESYLNLGILVARDLDLNVTVGDRVKKGMHAFRALTPFLRDSSIPVALKSDKVIKGLLSPVLTYGGELFGMAEQRAVPLQRVLNKAMRLVMSGHDSGKWCSPSCLMDELRVFPVAGAVAGLRARALAKYRSSKTLIAALVRQPLVARKSTWVSGGRRWLRRYLPALEGLDAAVNTQDLEAVLESDPKELGRAVKRMMWRRMNKRNARDHVTYMAYVTQDMVATRSYLVNALRIPHIAVGVRALMQARCGAFVTAARAAGAGLIDETCLDLCPFCFKERPESLRHMFLSCKAWKPARRAHLWWLVKDLIPHYARARGVADRLHGWEMVTLLLGGSVAGVSLGGLWSGDRAFTQRYYERAREPAAFMVARFLQAIHADRRAILRPLRLQR